jgi:4-oxalocrotonate tautomerase
MPFVNYKLPERALTGAQKEQLIHRTTALLVEMFGENARPHTMVLVEDIPDGGYGRADEVFVMPRLARDG